MDRRTCDEVNRRGSANDHSGAGMSGLALRLKRICPCMKPAPDRAESVIRITATSGVYRGIRAGTMSLSASVSNRPAAIGSSALQRLRSTD